MNRPLLFLRLVCLFFGLGCLLAPAPTGALNPPHLIYGFNMAELDYPLLQNMGFGWAKLFAPPGGPQPARVLLRIDANVTHFNDLSGFANSVRTIAINNGPYIDAYEIGNEPNLDASYGWGAPPVAADYLAVLCTAYTEIKTHDPTAIVVSAGLAPTGRVSGTWNGHLGHNGTVQDEREYLRELLPAGTACLDVVGYHPYGFSADFDATPDVASTDPRQNCANGFCFRGTEKIYEVMAAEGAGDRKIWATEFGWIVTPPDYCLDDPDWDGRAWQLVSETQQAANLAGALDYADYNWPWLGAVFIFNLNFNTAPWFPECEQMRYYAVEDRPAESALRNLPKNPTPITPQLLVAPGEISWLMAEADGSLPLTLPLFLGNGGWDSFNYDVAVDGGADLVPTLSGASGGLAPTGVMTVAVTLPAGPWPVGIHSGSLTVSADPGTLDAPQTVPVTLRVVDTLYFTYMPVSPRR